MLEVRCPILVGRAGDLDALATAVDETVAGRGRCVVISGEAGIGKSRLVTETTRLATERGLGVVAGRAVPASRATAYRPVTEALLQLLRTGGLPEDPSLRPWLAHLAGLLPGVVTGAGPAEPARPAEADALRGEAVLQLIRRLSPAGIVVAIEDMHWADPDTVALLEYLADNLAGEPVLLVASLRTEPSSPASDLVRRLRGRPSVMHLVLERLAVDEVGAMISACCPEADDETRVRIVRAAEGVPLLVEELLASPGIPGSITDTVRARLAEFPGPERGVLETAAVIGHHFDWEILPAATGRPPGVVSRALSQGVERSLLAADGDGFRFRHALTREAVLAVMMGPRVRETAVAALAAIDAAHPYLEGRWREVAADLSARAGDTVRSGRLLLDAGRSAVEVGALATAADTLRRSIGMLEEGSERDQAELALIEALALAGRVDEAALVAGPLVARRTADPAAEDVRIEAHLWLAQAAVTASRWPLAEGHIRAAAALADAGARPGLSARVAVLGADAALGQGDLAAARAAAHEVLATDDAAPDARCHAYEIVGRSWRLQDMGTARVSFEAALATAESHGLPIWRLRALHELGTVDMFTRAEVDRLLAARRLGEEMGALSTVAVLDLQLSACFTARWDLERCDAHASSALATARRLGLHQVGAKALALMAGSASMRGDRDSTERLGGEAQAADPSDPMLAAFCRASVGMALLMGGDLDAALRPFDEGTAALARLPNAEPMAVRALWPVVRAAKGDRQAAATIDQACRGGVDAFHANRGMIDFARAVLEGRAGRPERADAIISRVGTAFVNCETWADLVRFVAAPRALADGWGEPLRWLGAARDRFAALGLSALARQCADLLSDTAGNPWTGQGITDREADVLRLVIDGLANKEIAAALGLSPRTVEKHVESLLRKAGARSRTELAVSTRRATT